MWVIGDSSSGMGGEKTGKSMDSEMRVYVCVGRVWTGGRQFVILR